MQYVKNAMSFLSDSSDYATFYLTTCNSFLQITSSDSCWMWLLFL